MKTIRRITLFATIVSKIALCKLSASDDIRLVEAISCVESGSDDSAVGPLTARGERALGRYQILPSTWRDRTDWPVEYAHHHLKARVVAVAHIQWLRAQLEKREDIDQVTTYHVICAYRYGHAYKGRWDTREMFLARNAYVTRVKNMYELGQQPHHQPLID